MVALIARGRASGQIGGTLPPDALMLSARAFIHGLCRMWIDGHFPEWRVEKPPEQAMGEALDLFIDMIGGCSGACGGPAGLGSIDIQLRASRKWCFSATRSAAYLWHRRAPEARKRAVCRPAWAEGRSVLDSSAHRAVYLNG